MLAYNKVAFVKLIVQPKMHSYKWLNTTWPYTTAVVITSFHSATQYYISIAFFGVTVDDQWSDWGLSCSKH